MLPVLTVLVALTRVPSFVRPLWSPDEGCLAVQARIPAGGGELYRTVVDRKPPLVPWPYEGAFAVFGSGSPASVRVLAVVVQVSAAVLPASLARRRRGDRAGRTAGVLYALVSIGLNPEDAQAATFEVFMLPCTAAAMWCADRRRWGGAGPAVACSFLVEQTGAAVLVPVLRLLWRHAESPRRGLLWTGVGALAPVAAVALLTDPAGLLFRTVTGSGAYASFTGSELHVLGRGLVNAAILTVACAGLVRPVAGAPRVGRPGSADLWLWLGSATAAVLTGFHFFGHYYLQLRPPAVLLATASLQILPRERAPTAVVTSVCCCVLFLAWGLLAPRPELARSQRLAAAVAHRTRPGDRVLVWGIHPEA